MSEKEKEAVTSEENESTLTKELDEENRSNEEINDEEKEQLEDSNVQEQKELNEKINSLIDEKEQLSDRLLRLQAEFENYKRRTKKERIEERKYKSQDLANELLSVLDNFERALQVEVTEGNEGIIDGITMVYNQFIDAFKSEGIEAIETENQSFDPNFHHAVMQIEDEDYDSNIIVEELQKGYKIKDRVIRPAMVKVNK